ncbi:hypothetical protein SAY86_029453 [Trapa natans]|uniref:Uncharacterized protein n=1 Tax=Trapa natans TaxID=22666 RepID=A0AAN7M3B9_TRANT|nr:hypothetical protein SAY86_029453 [Trapa natans]
MAICVFKIPPSFHIYSLNAPVELSPLRRGIMSKAWTGQVLYGGKDMCPKWMENGQRCTRTGKRGEAMMKLERNMRAISVNSLNLVEVAGISIAFGMTRAIQPNNCKFSVSAMTLRCLLENFLIEDNTICRSLIFHSSIHE